MKWAQGTQRHGFADHQRNRIAPALGGGVGRDPIRL